MADPGPDNPGGERRLNLSWPEPKQDKRTRRWAWLVALLVTLAGALALAASVGDLRPRDLMFWRREQITYIVPTGPDSSAPNQPASRGATSQPAAAASKEAAPR